MTKLLDQNDDTFRPLPSGEWNRIWDNAGEVAEKLAIVIIQTAIKTKWLYEATMQYRIDEQKEYDAEHTNNG